MTNLEYHFRIICMFCGWFNHLIVPVLGKNGSAQHACERCKRYIIEIHSAEMD